MSHFVHAYGVSNTRVLPGNVCRCRAAAAVCRRRRSSRRRRSKLIGGFNCRSIQSYITVDRMSGRCRGGCGYFPGQNYSGNCQQCMTLIKARGQEKRGVTKRPRSLSPPPKSKSVNSGKSKHVKKVAKGTGHRSTKGRASDDDFEFSPSPPKPPTAVTATATISKGGAALPVQISCVQIAPSSQNPHRCT